MSTGANPVSSAVDDNALALQRECDWLSKIIEKRFTSYFEQEGKEEVILSDNAPSIASHESDYAKLVGKLELSHEERLILILALVPWIKPQLLDVFFIRNQNLDRGYTEFGGQCGEKHGGFLPTLETAVFVIAGDDLKARFRFTSALDQEHALFTQNVLKSSNVPSGEPYLNALLSPTSATIALLTTGVTHKPDFGYEFPAKLTTSLLEWHDLILPDEVMSQVSHITAWLEHNERILNDWDLKRHIKPGYRSLFHGPPGTGKTLTATLLGKKTDRDVYRIDLSMLVSKYIGETEKNLSSVFDQAERQRWILFFDEADALFGKRTQATTSNDRHANREISYLLQRVETFPGVVILATNLHGNIDDAFARRFQSMVYFPMPDANARLKLWQGIIGDKLPLEEDVDLETVAEKYELSGGSIINAVRYAAISSSMSARGSVSAQDLTQGIIREYAKDGKTTL